MRYTHKVQKVKVNAAAIDDKHVWTSRQLQQQRNYAHHTANNAADYAGAWSRVSDAASRS